MEKLSSTKAVPGVKEVGDHWSRETYTHADDPQLMMVQLTIFHPYDGVKAIHI